MTSSYSPSSLVEPILPISAFSYRNVGAPPDAHAHEAKPNVPADSAKPAAKEITQQEVDWLVEAARTEAAAETRAQMQAQMEARVAAEAEKTRTAIESFQREQKTYFGKVESEVIKLALAIAARILHRESQVDPMLVAGLVRVAIEKLHNGSSVTVRVSAADAAKYRALLRDLESAYDISVVEDPQMSANNCVLETELGSADFSVEAQLKEVERGFFDLLALRPQS
jgi:flagellar assembly protein FliH